MFYPKCPKCGGKTESTERYHHHSFIGGLGHFFPPLKVPVAIFGLGKEVVKRTPLLKKKCVKCGYIFN